MGKLRARIAGTGSYVPEKVLTNFDLEKMVETSDEWITTRTGIKERRIAEETIAASDMAVEAGKRALEAAGVEPEELDLIIVATITPDTLLPSTACWTQAKLGAVNAWAFDLIAACSGFVYSLAVGSQFIETGRYKNVLVVASEVLSRITDYQDRTTCILFGDGAGAVVLQPCEDEDEGILYFSLGADGTGAEYAIVPAGGSRIPASHESVDGRLHYIKMNGRELFKFAVTKMKDLIKEAMDYCGWEEKDVKLIVPHQVNQRIMEAAMERLGMGMDKLMINIDKYGNTSAASIPIALDEAVRGGRVEDGDGVILVAFGGGLTWGCAAVRW